MTSNRRANRIPRNRFADVGLALERPLRLELGDHGIGPLQNDVAAEPFTQLCHDARCHGLIADAEAQDVHALALANAVDDIAGVAVKHAHILVGERKAFAVCADVVVEVS